MRCLSSALASRLGGMPGSSGCTTTSSSSSCAICRSAWTGLSLGSGSASLLTRPDVESNATHTRIARALAGFVVGLLAGLLGLQVTRRIAGLGPTRGPARGRAVRVLRRRLGGGSARGVTALVRASSLGGSAARCGRPARVALLRDALLLGAQLGIEGAERIIEPLVDRRPALLRSLSRPVGARGGRLARPAARRRGLAGRRIGGGASARRGRLCLSRRRGARAALLAARRRRRRGRGGTARADQ